MNTLLKYGSFIFVAAFCFTSCSSDPCGSDKDDFLEKFDALVDKVKKIEYDTKNANWESYNEEFKMMVDECYETHADDLSRREEKEFGKEVATYYVKTFSGQVDFQKYASEFGALIDDNLSNFSKDLGSAIKDIDININLDDQEIEELFEELGSDIEKMGEKWGKKLEKILEKE